MGNKSNRRSRRLGTPSPERDLNETQVETSTQCNVTLTNIDSNTQGNLDDVKLRSQLIEPSQLSNEIQAWTENFEQKNNDRIVKMREEMKNKLDAILKEIKSNKSASTVTNRRSEVNDIQNMQPSGSKTNRSIGVHASFNDNSDSENEDYPFQASKMKDLKHPAKPLFRSESDVDVTIHSDEESDIEEDYHRDHERLRIEQRFTDMNKQIGELTIIVRALTEKISTSKEGNHQDVLNSETSTRSDNFPMSLAKSCEKLSVMVLKFLDSLIWVLRVMR